MILSMTLSFVLSYGQDTLTYNVHIVKAYILPIMSALSNYPELKNTTIYFKEANIESTGKTTIEKSTLFNRRHRKYIIYINNNKARTGFLLSELSIDKQEGVIGHELAHVADFSKRSFMEMIGWGLHYLNKKKRVIIERQTDESTISHGLRNELYAWSSFVLTSPLTTLSYKQMRLIYYMHPEEILKYK